MKALLRCSSSLAFLVGFEDEISKTPWLRVCFNLFAGADLFIRLNCRVQGTLVSSTLQGRGFGALSFGLKQRAAGSSMAIDMCFRSPLGSIEHGHQQWHLRSLSPQSPAFSSPARVLTQVAQVMLCPLPLR